MMNTVRQKTLVESEQNEYTDSVRLAYSYIRFSTPKQALGDSMRRQLAAAENFCKENGYILDTTLKLHDKGVSAFKGKNIEIGRLGEFVKLVKAGRIPRGAALCVENLDRLSRAEITDALGLFLDLIRDGVTVITLTDKRIYNRESINKNPGELMCSIVFLMRANDESKIKSVRVKEAYDKRKRVSKETGQNRMGWNPPWCDFENGKYVVNEERAKLIRRIYDEYLAGNGPFRICRKFNKENIGTLGHRGSAEYKNTSKTWYKKTVKDFLNDKRVYGYCEFLEKENFYPVIINQNIFDAVQARLAVRANVKTGGRSENVGNLFTGVCRCIKCGSVMRKTSTNKTYKGKTTHYEYLVCEAATTGKPCTYRSIPYPFLEDTFLQVLDTPSFFASLTPRKMNAVTSIESLKGELHSIEKQLARLTDVLLTDDNPPKTLVSVMKELENKKLKISKQISISNVSNNVSGLPAEYMEIINELPKRLQEPEFRLRIREFISSTIEAIKLDTENTRYVVSLKDGTVLTVMMARVGKEESKGVSFQVLNGLQTEYQPDAVLYYSK